MTKRLGIIWVLCFFMINKTLQAQGISTSDKLSPTSSFAIKSNLLYLATTSINLGGEFKVSRQYTLDLSINYNPWSFSNNKKFKHILIQPELRYWLESPYSKHFLGFHTLYAHYNVGGVKLPFGIFPSLRNNRYQGNLYGAGVAYGYQWHLTKQWNLETSIGLGYVYMDYNRYSCQTCGDLIESSHSNYFGVTKAGISIIYLLK